MSKGTVAQSRPRNDELGLRSPASFGAGSRGGVGNVQSLAGRVIQGVEPRSLVRRYDRIFVNKLVAGGLSRTEARQRVASEGLGAAVGRTENRGGRATRAAGRAAAATGRARSRG